MSQPQPHPRYVRVSGQDPDLPAERIDQLFYAALADIKRRRRRDELEPPTRGSSLNTVHQMPHWMRWS